MVLEIVLIKLIIIKIVVIIITYYLQTLKRHNATKKSKIKCINTHVFHQKEFKKNIINNPRL
jgi:hypothetical protein